MRTGNPDLTTNTRSCRTSVSELGWEVRSPKLWPSTFNSEILHTHPRITSSETVVSIHHEMAVLGKIPSAFLFTVSTALHSRINVYGYKPPNIYWALKQYLASSEKKSHKKSKRLENVKNQTMKMDWSKLATHTKLNKERWGNQRTRALRKI